MDTCNWNNIKENCVDDLPEDGLSAKEMIEGGSGLTYK